MYPPYLIQWLRHNQHSTSPLKLSNGKSLPTEADASLKAYIRSAFMEELSHEISTPKHGHHLQKDLIWDFMDNHDIEPTDTNWNSIAKIYLRMRKPPLRRRPRTGQE